MSESNNLLISPWQALQKDLARQLARSMFASYVSKENLVSHPTLAISWLLRARTRTVGMQRVE